MAQGGLNGNVEFSWDEGTFQGLKDYREKDKNCVHKYGFFIDKKMQIAIKPVTKKILKM